MKKYKSLYLILTLMIMIVIFSVGIQTEKNISKNQISQTHVQEVEDNVCELVETFYYYFDNSVEKPSVHINRVVAVVMVLSFAYFICIMLAMKIDMLFIRINKEQNTENKYSLQGVRQ